MSDNRFRYLIDGEGLRSEAPVLSPTRTGNPVRMHLCGAT